MMKCVFSINMYSGNMPPERDVTPQEIEKISELVSQLNVEWTDPNPFWGLGALSTDSYSVWWIDEEAMKDLFSNPKPFEGPWMMVQIRPGGPVHVYRKEEDFRGVLLKDTVGLWEYLATIGGPLLARHYRDIQEGISHYNEKVFGVSPEKKV